jgi:hypothetical protein
MKRALTITWLLVLLGGALQAEIPGQPDHTLLWNRFSAVTVVDSFAVATGENGLIVLKRSPGENQYREIAHLFLAAEGIAHKRRDSVLAVRTEIGAVYFFNLNALPQIELLGLADLDAPFADFAWIDDKLYVAREFDGLWQYQLSSFANPLFLDSSMIGIHCISVTIEGSYLYALDDYNGILRYDLTAPGFGQFLDYLYLPFRAHTFAPVDTQVVVAGAESELYRSTFDGGASLIDTIPILFSPDAVFAADTLAAVFSMDEPSVEILSLVTHSVYTSLLAAEVDTGFAGSTFIDSGGVEILMPSADGGLVQYPLSRMAVQPQPIQALARPGPITSVVIGDHTMYTAGTGNPVDRYALASDGAPSLDTTFFPGLNNVGAMTANGDTLFVYYSDFDRVFILETTPDSMVFLGSVRPNGLVAREIHYNPKPFDTVTSFYVVSSVLVELFSVSDSSGFLPQGQIGLVDPILDAIVVDSLLFLASKKSGLVIFRIYNDLSLEFRRTVGLSFQPTSLAEYDGRLFVFFGNELSIYTVGSPDTFSADTTVSIYREVTDCTVSGHHLYTVGPSGISIFDLDRPVPHLMAEGGRAGYTIAADSDLVAISDSVALHIYRVPIVPTDIPDQPSTLPDELVLHQNYPNPFNPETTIRFVLPRLGEIRLSVYNVLGQRVAELLHEKLAAGMYEVHWDGSTASGDRAASGVYFYRLETDFGTQTRKMMLLK